jgi:very-long-chain (3R)-3-hydroxyacyl-CoA dehydratase
MSPFYASMVFAWSFTEVVRYSHYTTGLLGIKVDLLEYLRSVPSLLTPHSH